MVGVGVRFAIAVRAREVYCTVTAPLGREGQGLWAGSEPL